MATEGNETGLRDAVEIFVKAGCPYCGALKRNLQEGGTTFVEHDVQRDAADPERRAAQGAHHFDRWRGHCRLSRHLNGVERRP